MLCQFEGITFDDALIESSIQEMEKEFGQINFDNIIANNQEENIQDKKKHMELTTIVSNAETEFDIQSEVYEIAEFGAVDIKQNQKNVHIQFDPSDIDRNSPFNDDLQMDSNKKIESLEIQTKVTIHNNNENSKNDLIGISSQPHGLVSSQSIKEREIDTMADGDLTDIKDMKLHGHTSLNKHVRFEIS